MAAKFQKPTGAFVAASWAALFIGNVVSVVLLNWLVPWVSLGFGWWLAPARQAGGRTNLIGAGLVAVLYGASLFLFSWF